MKKILVAVQFWANDAAQARAVTEFMAEIEPKFREDVTVMLVHRFDCPPPRPSWVKAVSKRFDVLVHKCRRYGTGWPHGPNEMWFDLVSRFYEMQAFESGPKYDCMLTLEADDVPLDRKWLNLILEEWESVGRPVMLGSKQMFPAEHINGNLLLTGDTKELAKIVRVAGVPPNSGWDYHLAGFFRKLGVSDSKRIRSFWATKTMTRDQLEQIAADGCALLHGVKDDTALDFAQEKVWRKLTAAP